MKLIIKLSALTVLCSGLFAILYFNDSLGYNKNLVILKKDGFYPREITVLVGTTVNFTTDLEESFWPASNLHPTHEIYSEFDPKKPINQEEEWTFQFNSPGAWRYHDHLNANFEGTIIVKNSLDEPDPVSLDDCLAIKELGKKQKCWDDKLESTIKEKGLDSAFKLFIDLYNTEPDIPKACHGWAHILGKTAFEGFRENKELIFREEISYCGYGFLHGFMEKMLQEEGEISKTKEFCDQATKKMGEKAGGLYKNCIHGIGHGSVDIEDESKWGNFQAMLEAGLRSCELVDLNAGELRDCFDGAFNAMSLYAVYGDYELKYSKEDPFFYCRDQLDKHKVSCYFEFVGGLSNATNHNFGLAANILIKERTNQEVARVSISKMAADFMQDDIANSDHTKNIQDCHNLPDYLRSPCFNGILVGFNAHGLPGKEHIKGLAFCENKLLTSTEKKLCQSTFSNR